MKTVRVDEDSSMVTVIRELDEDDSADDWDVIQVSDEELSAYQAALASVDAFEQRFRGMALAKNKAKAA